MIEEAADVTGGLYEIGSGMPSVPGSACAKERVRQWRCADHRRHIKQAAEPGTDVVRRGDRAGERCRRARESQGLLGHDVQVDRCEPAGEPCKGPQGPGAEYAGSEGERKYSAGENTAEAEIEKRGRGSGLVRRRPDGIGNGHRTSDIGSRCRIAVYG